MQREIRESNFELLRIVSMIFIVMHHYAIHGDFNSLSGGEYSPALLFVQILLIGGKLGVNCFVLISGYFLIMSSESTSRILRIWLQVFFYSVSGWCIAYIMGEATLGNELFKALFPVISEEYWFASAYVLMCLFSPYLNRYIKALDARQLLKNICLMLVVWSVMPTIWNIIPVNTKPSFQLNSFLWFCTLYMVAAYIRLYMNNEDKNEKYVRYFAIAIGTYFLIVLSIFVFDFLGARFGIFKNSAFMFSSDNSVLMTVMSISLFMGFRSIKLPANKVINKFAATTFGIYLIHDNKYMRSLIWRDTLKNGMFIDSPFLWAHALFSVVAVFCTCAIIDMIRIKLFAFIRKVYRQGGLCI